MQKLANTSVNTGTNVNTWYNPEKFHQKLKLLNTHVEGFFNVIPTWTFENLKYNEIEEFQCMFVNIRSPAYE